MPYDHDDTDDDNDHDHNHHRGDNGDQFSYNGDSSISGYLATLPPPHAATAPITVAVHVVTTKVDVSAVGAIVVSVSIHSLDLLLTLLCMLYQSQLSCCTSAVTDRGPRRT